MRPGQDTRIANLFRRGNSLDLVSELGALYGWTRADAKAVVADRGWALTWSGRLQPQYMREAMAVGESLADANPERLLNAGVDHENADIRRAARGVERALEKLRTELLAQEARDVSAAEVVRQEAMVLLQEALGAASGPWVPEKRVRVS